ncbi:MAG: DUF4422 domain-containing protein [Lachnospiraceae bacterium]|nr:DUF4422 domain-containing protein [Lachnospiraceae bacterium]
MDLVIYGAQGIALGAYEAIHSLYPKKKIRCFLVTERGANAEYLSGVPVLELVPFACSLSNEEKENIEVLIATPENVMEEIEKCLDGQGLHCHVRLTSKRWAQLMGYYYACSKEYIPLSSLPVGYHRAELNLFIAKFYKDKPLTNQYAMPEWVTPIQVGAALCGVRIADILDCDGDNISGKNGNYSELTALYWLWKNRLLTKPADNGMEYYGLAHYRRILELSEDDMLRLSDNDIDAVLPYPMPYEPDIHEHHKRYLSDDDWRALLAALKDLQPEYADAFPTILGQRYFYNYNIIIARKDVLAEYCSWLFPILERVEELSTPLGSERSDRYIGYMGETLETLYFMHNKDKLNIVHAGCIFLR